MAVSAGAIAGPGAAAGAAAGGVSTALVLPLLLGSESDPDEEDEDGLDFPNNSPAYAYLILLSPKKSHSYPSGSPSS